MKISNRILALILALVLAFSVSAVCLAEDGDIDDTTTTVAEAVEDDETTTGSGIVISEDLSIIAEQGGDVIRSGSSLGYKIFGWLTDFFEMVRDWFNEFADVVKDVNFKDVNFRWK